MTLYLQKTNFSEPLRKVSETEADRIELNYYDSDVHRGCFIWPRCLKKVECIIVDKDAIDLC